MEMWQESLESLARLVSSLQSCRIHLVVWMNMCKVQMYHLLFTIPSWYTPLKPELLFHTKFPWRKVVQDIQVVCVHGQGQGARNPETHWGSIHPLLQHQRKPGDKPASLRTKCNCPGASVSWWGSKQTFQFKWFKCSGAACSGEITILHGQENMTVK